MAQPPVSIAGFQVQFPYRPYGTQLAFMNQFLRAVDTQGNALLEAPTGSGKTACLLAASAMSWCVCGNAPARGSARARCDRVHASCC